MSGKLLEQNEPGTARFGLQTNKPAIFNGLVTFNGGRVNNYITGQGATVTLTAAQSGSTALFDRAAGIVYTLPIPVVGLTFTFLTTVSITTNSAKVITDAGTTLLIGAIDEALSGGAPNQYVGNGSTHIAVLGNGTTTGALQGSRWEFTAVSTSLWQVNGWNIASGTIVTPFSTT